ncbi:MAG: amino-acid transporter subunit [Cyanobacteriota bacterium]
MAPPFRLAAAIPLIASLGLLGCANEGGGLQSPKMATIQARGRLVCGVDGKLPGFSFVTPDGSSKGMDVDICRATAAALLGDPDKVDYRPLDVTDRFAALASGEVDLLSRNTTYTLSRDAAGGNAMSFAPTVFYDGQGVMVPSGSGIQDLKDLAGKPICVPSGSTSELNLANRMRELGLPYTPLKFQTLDQTYAAYLSARCSAVSTDRSQLAAKRSSFPDPAAHALLPVVMSKEPLTPATVNADPVWADAVRWVVYALFQAEELGITQANVEAKLAEAKANPALADLRRFLGVEGSFGQQLGLKPDFVVRLIKAGGNYGEIYERTLGNGSSLKLDRGHNRLWKDGGLLYSPPF